MINSGHYVFSSNAFQKLKNEFLEKIEDKRDFDNFLKLEIQ